MLLYGDLDGAAAPTDILAAKLRPGDKMHVKRVREIGATPLREALFTLTALDLVTAVGQRGFAAAK